MESKIIGSYLKNVRLKKGYSEEYVSSKLNISQSSISNFENGRVKMDVTRLIQFCNVLDIHVQELVNELLEIHYEMKGSGPDIIYDPTPIPVDLAPIVERIDKLEKMLDQQNKLISQQTTLLARLMEK